MKKIGRTNLFQTQINLIKSDKPKEINREKDKLFFDFLNIQEPIPEFEPKLEEPLLEVNNLKKEQKNVIKEANIQEAKLKDNINNINTSLENIKFGTIPAEAAKVFELKKACEEVLSIKEQNDKLRERLYLLSRRLYSLEVNNFFLIFE